MIIIVLILVDSKMGLGHVLTNLYSILTKYQKERVCSRLKETPGVQVFVTEKFKGWIEEHKLKGLNFSVYMMLTLQRKWKKNSSGYMMQLLKRLNEIRERNILMR